MIVNGGANVLVGSGGNDILTGNGGADTFLYAPDPNFGGDLGGGDIITDFVHGTDKIDVSAIDSGDSDVGDFTFNGLTPTANGIWYTESGGNTILHFDTDDAPGTVGTPDDEMTLTLVGTSLGLTAADFVL